MKLEADNEAYPCARICYTHLPVMHCRLGRRSVVCSHSWYRSNHHRSTPHFVSRRARCPSPAAVEVITRPQVHPGRPSHRPRLSSNRNTSLYDVWQASVQNTQKSIEQRTEYIYCNHAEVEVLDKFLPNLSKNP